MADNIKNKTKDLISVLIATYNRCQHLEELFASLLELEPDDRFDHEIIVVDNNSRDATKLTVDIWIPRFEGKLRYFFEPRQSKMFALNKGLPKCRGFIIALTDDDCLVAQDWLIRIYETFNNKNIDLLAGRIQLGIDAPLPKWSADPLCNGPLGRFDLGDEYIENTRSAILAYGANMGLRASSITKFGPYQKVGRSQDTEICYRWHQQGARIGYAPDVLVLHKTPSSRLNKRYILKSHYEWGKYRPHLDPGQFRSKHFLFGVPGWVLKQLALSIGRYLKGLLSLKKNNFPNEVMIFYNFGLIVSHFRMVKNSGGRTTPLPPNFPPAL